VRRLDPTPSSSPAVAARYDGARVPTPQPEWRACALCNGLPFGTRARRFFDHRCGFWILSALGRSPQRSGLAVWSLSPASRRRHCWLPAVAYAAVPLDGEPSRSPSRRRPPARERRMAPSTSRRASGATIVSGSRKAPGIANRPPVPVCLPSGLMRGQRRAPIQSSGKRSSSEKVSERGLPASLVSWHSKAKGLSAIAP
jgi:hypothetical protein